jgi:hypothetical protein
VLKEAHNKAAMKKTQVYMSHKFLCLSMEARAAGDRQI